MRRTHLRRHENILKRLLTHVAGFNLGILMRNLIGKATPKEYAELNASLIAALLRFVSTIGARFAPLQSIGRLNLAVPPNHIFLELAHQTFSGPGIHGSRPVPVLPQLSVGGCRVTRSCARV